MQFLTLASLLFVPTVWAAAAPYQCKAVFDPAYLAAYGPVGMIEFFNVSQQTTSQNYNYIQKDGRPDLGDEGGAYGSTSGSSLSHELFQTYHCHLQSSNSTMPSSFLQVRPHKDSSKCVSLSGAAPKDGHLKSNKEGYTEENTIVVKSCADPSDSMFPYQMFRKQKDGMPVKLETVDTEEQAQRFNVGFSGDKVYLMTDDPEVEGQYPESYDFYLTHAKSD